MSSVSSSSSPSRGDTLRCVVASRGKFSSRVLGFVAGETLVVVIGFDLLWTLLTFQFARVLGSDEFGKQDQDGYSPLGGNSPVDAPDPLSF